MIGGDQGVWCVPSAVIELPRFDIGTSPWRPAFSGSVDKIRYARLPIFLFRAQGCSRSFAYSLDVTGRNIPPLAEHEEWLYVGAVAAKQLEADPEALGELRTVGFYVFKE